MSKYVLWASLIVGSYAYSQYRGYYIGSFFTGSSWTRTGHQALTHK